MLYATPGDLSAAIGKPVDQLPADALFALRRASYLVADATVAAVYETTADGQPREPRLRDAMRAAALEYVTDALNRGIRVGAGVDQLPKQVASKSALGVSVSYALASRGEAETLATGTRLTNTAWGILARAGLTSGPVAGTR